MTGAAFREQPVDLTEFVTGRRYLGLPRLSAAQFAVVELAEKVFDADAYASLAASRNPATARYYAEVAGLPVVNYIIAQVGQGVEPLRTAGVALLRLDHPGKDTGKGTRGSSAKFGDVDVEWELTAESALSFRLNCRKDRPGHNPGLAPILVRRCSEPLRHEVTHSSVTARGHQLVADLERLGVPHGASKRAVRAALKADGIKASDTAIVEALRQWKQAPSLSLLDPTQHASGGDVPHSPESAKSGSEPPVPDDHENEPENGGSQ